MLQIRENDSKLLQLIKWEIFLLLHGEWLDTTDRKIHLYLKNQIKKEILITLHSFLL